MDLVARINNNDQVGLIKKPEITETAISQRTYTVQKGDTLSTIAETFNLNVATILEANNIKGSDTADINVGFVLNIPPEITSTSLAWLAEEQKARLERERQARAEAAKRVAASNSRQVAFRTSTREVAGSGFDQFGSKNFIVPIRYRQQTRCNRSYHRGSDLTSDLGTPVIATADGKVVERTGGYGRGYGLSLVVDHGGGVQSRYAHLSKYAVGLGENVSQGQVIAYSGNTGFSTGPHLHFDKIVNGRNVGICF